MKDNSDSDQVKTEPRYRLSLREVLDRADSARARTRQLVDQLGATAGAPESSSSM